MNNTLAQCQITNWMRVSRLPFTTVGTVPFCAGVFIAYRSQYPLDLLASVMGLLAVFLICVTCYLIGEISDQEEDLLTLRYGRSRFAGGTLLVAMREMSEKSVTATAAILFCVAVFLGFYISYLHSNWVLFCLGAFGGISALLYSLPPVRFVKRGLGELLIAICYGWLPVVTGFMTATGEMPPYSWIFTLPIALSIFNVIYINEFPDYESDRLAGKNNLVVRMGKELASKVYGMVAFFVAIFTILVWYFFRSENSAFLLIILPVVFLGLFLALRVSIQLKWKDRKDLEPICGLSIVLNHLTSITIAIVVVF